ncbi:RING finger and transmembrane domain-containing protein 2 [Dufourea novaeangliae]|uniref:RING finger and transmembrane domain-containing protein 2 n=2 Tax=Dufourea novaeangliae TaxID=178035 RepID=A0A154PPX8_DUFNO|nr:RING finger and transmembrane domain-containing protein 2 [Dufourea novaeangliae]
MTHSSIATRSIPFISIRDFNFSASTMEHSRIFANNISSTIEEIRPFVEHQPGISLSSLLNIQRIQTPLSTIIPSADNYIINIEDQPISGTHPHNGPDHNHHHHQITATDNFLNNIREAANEVVGENHNNNSNIAINHNNNNNNNNIEENSADALQGSVEARALLRGFRKYILFISLLLAKGLYDHKAGVFNFIVLFVTFNHANNVVKREIAKQNNKSWISLLVITCYVLACIVFINFEYDTHIFSPYTQPLTIWELMWSVLITDFILKLITIVCKVFLTCLPSKLLALRQKGKYYLVLEATSQFYRCIAPVQPWLYYFFEAYQGPEKILGVFISVLYIVSKGTDLLSCLKLLQTAVCKLFQNMNLGVSPSKEQLMASGGICAICHEEYSMPVRLHCNHIFCETCVLTWLDRERSCPLCRAVITDDPIYRDGHTTYSIQLY